MNETKNSQYHHGDLRRALLDAAALLVERDGLGTLSLREVAREAKVSHGAPRHHFGSKAGLLTALATDAFEAMQAAIVEEAGKQKDRSPKSFFEAVGLGYVRYAVNHPGMYSLLFRRDLVDPTEEGYKRSSDAAWGMLNETVMALSEVGFIDKKETPMIAALSWSVAHGLSLLTTEGRLADRFPKLADEAFARRVVKMYVSRIVQAN